MKKGLGSLLILLPLLIAGCQKDDGSEINNNENEVSVTGTATDIDESSAIIHGYAYFTPDDKDVIFGIIISTETNPTSEKGIMILTPDIDSNNKYSITITGLTSNTAYYYCSFASIGGKNYTGRVKNFITTKHYDYVDLGLSVKWATCNVDADKPEDGGNYYAWGEVEPKNEYTWTSYKYCNGSSSTINKYNSFEKWAVVDNKITLEPEDDVAHVKWGGSWRMPTKAEQDELREYCTWTWTRLNGSLGCRITSNIPGYEKQSIFLPAADLCDDEPSLFPANPNDNKNEVIDSLSGAGFYWSSSLYTVMSAMSYTAYALKFDSDGRIDWFYPERMTGLSVRPVRPSEEWIEHIALSIKDSVSLATDGFCKLNVDVKYDDSDYLFTGIIWASDNPSVATVDDKGFVTAVSLGIAHISASIRNISAQCTVTVFDESKVKKEYVDLGLSVKWATCNVGAAKPEDIGNYYAWGETVTKKDYSFDTYKWCHGSFDKLTKYNNDNEFGIVDKKTVLDLEDDVAHIKWRGNWRMPTSVEIEELLNSCTWIWITDNDFSGYQVISNKPGYEGRSIFLPYSGFFHDINYYDYDGMYWSSSLSAERSVDAYNIILWGDTPELNYNPRCYGFPVRPVCP